MVLHKFNVKTIYGELEMVLNSNMVLHKLIIENIIDDNLVNFKFQYGFT